MPVYFVSKIVLIKNFLSTKQNNVPDRYHKDWKIAVHAMCFATVDFNSEYFSAVIHVLIEHNPVNL